MSTTLLDAALARFQSRIHKTPTCWLFTGALSVDGYGKVSVAGRDWRAHRYAWTVWRGPIPQGMVLDHLCRVRHCVNPDHLEVVGNRTNLLRGDTLAAANAAKTHCPQGHPYDEANTQPQRDGRSRACRACNRAYLARRRSARKAVSA